jgi:hypothetical protein
MVLVPLLVAGTAAPGADASGREAVYSLYRTGWPSRETRIHVATFDAFEPAGTGSAAHNAANCDRVARMLNDQPATGSRYWCEPGRHRADLAALKNRPAPPRSRQGLRKDSAAACTSAVASRQSTPEDLATACTGWSALEIARAEVRFLSGMCKADSIQDCDRLCFHAPHDLPPRERTKITTWACRRRSEIKPPER